MRSILIVDDDAGMVETLEDILAARNYRVATADSGEAAIEHVGRTAFDVVLMDIKMPGLNGVEALQVMRRMTPTLSVIMMTAFTRDELVDQAHRAAAVAVVAKPLDLDHLLAVVDGISRSSCERRKGLT
jgi:DNA-binding NtrC family response regulator